MRTPLYMLCTAAALGLLASTAHAEIDLEVANNAKITTSMAAGEGIQIFRFHATAGSQLSFKAGAKGKGVTDVDIELEGPEGGVDMPTAKDAGKKVSGKKIILPLTGFYRFEVSSEEGNGDVAVSIKVKPAKTVSETVVGAEEGEEVEFAAPAGSSLKIQVKAAKGSSATPLVQELNGDDTETDLTDFQKLKTIPVADVEGGDMSLSFDNNGPTGDVTVKIKIKAPKVKAQKLDLRGADKGTTAPTFVGRTIDANEGGVIEVNDEGSDLDGAMIEIGEGDLPDDTLISMSSVSAPALGDPENEQAAGPAIDLQPSGLLFNNPVKVTLPFDLTSVGAQDNPTEVLRVFLQEDDGSFTVLVPTEVDVEAGTVCVEIPGFSTCVVITPSGGAPRLEGRDYWWMSFSAVLLSSEGNDSRAREFWVDLGDASFAGPPGEEAGFIDSYEERGIFFVPNTSGPPVFESFVDAGPYNESTWDYMEEGIGFFFAGDEDDDEAQFAFTFDGTVMVDLDDDLDEGQAESGIELFVEKCEDPETEVVGTYWYTDVITDAVQMQDGRFDVGMGHGLGTVTFLADGTLKYNVKSRFWFGSGEFLEFERETFKANGTWEVLDGESDYPGALLVTLFDDEGDEELLFLPGAEGDVLLGTDFEHPEDEALFMLLVRQASGANNGQLDGLGLAAGMEIERMDYTLSAGPQADFGLVNGLVTLEADGNGGA
ncbi:MAG: hypothetical protein ACYTG4_04560, partial [Planctomycetota bacterium]